MGLLELAQQQKQGQIEDKTEKELEENIDNFQGNGLLAMAKRAKSKPASIQSSKKLASELLKKFNKPHRIIEEKRGFGYKGLGTRKIIQIKKTTESLETYPRRGKTLDTMIPAIRQARVRHIRPVHRHGRAGRLPSEDVL